MITSQPQTARTASGHEWDTFIDGHPQAHLLQTRPWGELKSAFGWQAHWVIYDTPDLQVGAQILFRRILPGLSMAYLPRGPVSNPARRLDDPSLQSFWQAVDRLCRAQHAVFLKVEPDEWQERMTLRETPSSDAAETAPPAAAPEGFRPSDHSIQPPRTIVIDLAGSEEQILARMKQKTRYNIRLAQKRGVCVQPSADLAGFYRLMELTGVRDGFGVHSKAYFEQAYTLFHPTDSAELLMADYEGQPLAGLMVFQRGGRAWYLYGASSNEHRDLMATYLIQWEAMRWARQRQCLEYDLWGVPDAGLAELEAHFSDEQRAAGGLWGVYRFKRGFGGELCRAAGPFDRVYNSLAYAGYRWRVSRSAG